MALAALMALLAVSSARRKAPTFDETVHLTGGAAILEKGDFRVNPENGVLPQILEALPTALTTRTIPIDTTGDSWCEIRNWDIAADFLFRSGNDHKAMFMAARTMVVILGVLCALAVFAVSKRIWGTPGGLLSVALFALSPTMLAHTRLATSDMAATLFFILSLLSFQMALEKLTPGRALAAAASVACLFLSKMSAPLVIPVLALMGLFKIFSRRPWLIVLGQSRWVLENHRKRGVAFLALLLLTGVTTWISIWMVFGLRYSMLSDNHGTDTLSHRWEQLLANPSPPVAAIASARKWRILPEAYLYGYAHVFSDSKRRHAFLNGEYSDKGWWYFFPAAFAMKTPPETILLILLGVFLPWLPFGGRGSREKDDDGEKAPAIDRRKLQIQRLLPYLLMLTVYLCVSMSGNLNIGQRHLLPIYPILFLIAGGAAVPLLRWRPPAGKLLLATALVVLAIENAMIYPDYLAYFSPVAGGPDNGYKHLVDSSLDWGQDLEGVKKWLDEQHIPEDKTYLAYFGTVDLTGYGMPQKRLLCYFEQNLPIVFPLEGGVYCISATMLQMAYFPWFAKWNDKLERSLEAYRRDFQLLRKALNDRKLYSRLIKERGPHYWIQRYRRYEVLRFAKLAAALRKRKPDHIVGHSFFIYNLSDADIKKMMGKETP